jgi:glutathione reductase (NADPH)
VDSYDYDLLVVGAGSGGLAASKRAASYGAKVAIVEQGRVGGTCVIRGCIPKKLMVYAGELGHALGDATGYGWPAACPGAHDWQALVVKRDHAVATLETRHEELLAKAGVELLRGRARLVGPHDVDLGGRRLRVRYTLVATGARPILPRVDGIEHAITSDGFFELSERPQSVVIVGGGYIAVEFASILRALGSRVSLIIRGGLPLRGFDDDLRRELADALAANGIELHLETTVRRIVAIDGGVRVAIERAGIAGSIDADRSLVYATGRAPATDGLGLDEIGVRRGPRGEILTDEHGATSVPSIFAVGDVTDQIALTPVAIQAGRVFADRTFGGKKATMSYQGVATAVFSDPPIGTVGETEAAAIERLGPDRVRVFKAEFTPLMHTLTQRKSRTLVKLVVDRDSDRVLGCHMIGKDAPEIIQGFAVALKAEATKADFDATVGIHPSSAEEFVTLV